tara:strand:- start:1371 stop:1499 length:129 start_codon:yes stop_codon:yes gene_type:complete
LKKYCQHLKEEEKDSEETHSLVVEERPTKAAAVLTPTFFGMA